MKTQLPVRSNFGANMTEMAIRQAIHVLQDACRDELVLMMDEEVGVYLIPAILGSGMEATEVTVDGKRKRVARPAGTIEYQVSDGLPEHRSTSFDFYTLEAAIEAFDKVVQVGWKGYLKYNSVS